MNSSDTSLARLNTMRTLRLVTAAAAAVALLPALGTAQLTRATPTKPHRIEITPYAGVMLPSNLVSGPLGTHVGMAVGPLYGAQLGVSLVDGIALVGNVGIATADLEAGLPILGGVSFGKTEALLYDGGVQLSLPTSSAVRPFVHLGVGGISREISVSSVSVSSTAAALNAGLGVDLSLGDGVAVRLLARDHFGKFDYGEAVLFDYNGGTMHNIALSGGLRLSV